jgi:hypothetical protein
MKLEEWHAQRRYHDTFAPCRVPTEGKRSVSIAINRSGFCFVLHYSRNPLLRMVGFARTWRYRADAFRFEVL